MARSMLAFEAMGTHAASLGLLLALSATVAACSSGSGDGWGDPCDRVGDPAYYGPGYGVIGPEGGVVEETDPTSPIAGVRVEVEPGAWDECWEVYVFYETIFGTPDYPDGFVPFERPNPTGSVDIEIGLSTSDGFYRAPDPLPMRLSFPMGGIVPEAVEVRTAYFFDDARQDWRIAFPAALTDDRMTVATGTHDALWSWGLLDLSEVDFAAYVEPAMAEHYGSATWAQIEAAVDEAYREGLEANDLATCVGLDIAEGFFIALRDASEASVLEYQMGLGCGECNALSTEFYEGISEYIQLNIEAILAELFIDVIPDRIVFFPLKLAAYAAWLAAEAAIASLPCDYPCFVESANPALFVNVALYFGSYATLELIDWYRNAGYVTCPP